MPLSDPTHTVEGLQSRDTDPANTDWTRVLDPSTGLPYYYHKVTKAAQWKCPDALEQLERDGIAWDADGPESFTWAREHPALTGLFGLGIATGGFVYGLRRTAKEAGVDLKQLSASARTSAVYRQAAKACMYGTLLSLGFTTTLVITTIYVMDVSSPRDFGMKMKRSARPIGRTLDNALSWPRLRNIFRRTNAPPDQADDESMK